MQQHYQIQIRRDAALLDVPVHLVIQRTGSAAIQDRTPLVVQRSRRQVRSENAVDRERCRIAHSVGQGNDVTTRGIEIASRTRSGPTPLSALTCNRRNGAERPPAAGAIARTWSYIAMRETTRDGAMPQAVAARANRPPTCWPALRRPITKLGPMTTSIANRRAEHRRRVCHEACVQHHRPA